MDVVSSRTLFDDTEMRDPLERCCCTFVLALRKHHPVNASGLTLLRTYTAPHADPALCTIWEAVRATTATVSFFKSVAVPVGDGDIHADLVDAGTGYNNPSQQVLEEARKIWGERQIGCLISVGTGHQTVVDRLVSTPPSPILLRAANASVAADCEKTHASILKHIGNPQYPLSGPHSYFRFNVDSRIQDADLWKWENLRRDVGIWEWQNVRNMEEHTLRYMIKDEVVKLKSQCVEKLVGRANPQIASSPAET
jgi:hypothetical protein